VFPPFVGEDRIKTEIQLGCGSAMHASLSSDDRRRKKYAAIFRWTTFALRGAVMAVF